MVKANQTFIPPEPDFACAKRSSKMLFDDDESILSLCSYEVFVDQLNQTCSNTTNIVIMVALIPDICR